MLVNGAGGAVTFAVGRNLPDQVIQAAVLVSGHDFVRITDVGRGSLHSAVLGRQDRIWVLFQSLFLLSHDILSMRLRFKG